jgi:hypothetical protein
LSLENIRHGFKTFAACRGIRGVDDTSGLKIFFSRTSRPNSIKLGTNYSWVKRILVFQIKGQTLFKGEIITKM